MTQRVKILRMLDNDLLGTTEEALLAGMVTAQNNIDAMNKARTEHEEATDQAIEREKAQIQCNHECIQRRRELVALQEKGG